MYEGKLATCTPQKLVTCLAYRYACGDRSQGYLLIVAVHYGSYLRADKYPYKVVDWSFDLQAFFF